MLRSSIINMQAARRAELKSAAGGSRLLIKGGLVIDPSQNLEAVRDVLLENGRVAKVAAGLSKLSAFKDVPILDAAGKWVVPGLIDMHVHLREPGREGDETIATGTLAAARGGITTLLAMPNTEPVVDSVSILNLVLARAHATGLVNVLVASAATLGQNGEQLVEFFKLKKAGAAAFTDDGRPFRSAAVLRRVLEYAGQCGLPVIDHCEDLDLSGGAPVHEGYGSTIKGLKGAPWAAETVQVLRDISLSEFTGTPIHLAHISAAQSVEAVRWAKKRGIKVTAEVTPHHITLCDEDIPGYDANFKMNPPLRGKSDREALLEGLADGTIDVIATDHAPHSPAKKARGMQAAPFGVIGLETSLALGITKLVGTKTLSRKALIERMSTAPARVLGLKHKGSLKPGSDADVTVVDPSASWSVADLASKSRNSPFMGMKLKGRAAATIVGGRVVHAV